MTWAKSFREAFCERYGCAPKDFEHQVLRRTLHYRSILLATVIRTVRPDFFELELRTLGYLGNARSSEEFRAEVATYRSDYRRRGGFFRNICAVRLSGQKLMNLAVAVTVPSESGPARTSPVQPRPASANPKSDVAPTPGLSSPSELSSS